MAANDWDEGRGGNDTISAVGEQCSDDRSGDNPGDP